MFVGVGNSLSLCVRGVSYRSIAPALAPKYGRPCTPPHPHAHTHTRTHPHARTHAQRNAKRNPSPTHTHARTHLRAHAHVDTHTRAHVGTRVSLRHNFCPLFVVQMLFRCIPMQKISIERIPRRTTVCKIAPILWSEYCQSITLFLSYTPPNPTFTPTKPKKIHVLQKFFPLCMPCKYYTFKKRLKKSVFFLQKVLHMIFFITYFVKQLVRYEINNAHNTKESALRGLSL